MAVDGTRLYVWLSKSCDSNCGVSSKMKQRVQEFCSRQDGSASTSSIWRGREARDLRAIILSLLAGTTERNKGQDVTI